MDNAIVIVIKKSKIKQFVYIVLMVAMLFGVPIFNATAMMFGAATPIINLDE